MIFKQEKCLFKDEKILTNIQDLSEHFLKKTIKNNLVIYHLISVFESYFLFNFF
ncbi:HYPOTHETICAL PROTEIN MCJ_004520 [Mesomycoplasma conjunctivae]|uniref:Uncharacterized protein n=1 Tax=Mesomycoplasma conjunctivae (strain ATCC 25834 / NCTC 10147 / HRC/581) TaxID=572263 RepID=C5J6P5_MESCH|nr:HYPOTHETICAL PROTEIN MCJ_004520 [Mesomycoplasma conjunctivae]